MRAIVRRPSTKGVMASIGELASIPLADARNLRKSGVRTTEGLLKEAATKKGRIALAEAIGVTPDQVLLWVRRADMMRIKGVGAEYAELLSAAGVESIRALRRRNPGALTAQIYELNGAKGLVSRLPTEGMVASWIESAANIEPLVKA